MIKPILSNLLVEPEELSMETASGILFEKSNDPIIRGKVISVGKGRYNYPMVVSTGDIVYYRRNGGVKIKDKLLLEQDEVLAVETNKPY